MDLPLGYGVNAMVEHFPHGLPDLLAATYGNVNNIDLWIGGLAEDHLPNSSLGITFTRILVDQFSRLRDGDRFWYQNALPADLVHEIQGTSLADIVHRNTNLTSLQDNVFFFDEEATSIEAAPQPLQEQIDRDGGRPTRQDPPQNNNGRPPRNGRRPLPQNAPPPPRRQ